MASNLIKLQVNDYCPNGNTALHDAIGIIASAERLNSSNLVKNGKKKVVFVIMRIHEEISKINAEIVQKLGERISVNYIISGERGEKRKILLKKI